MQSTANALLGLFVRILPGLIVIAAALNLFGLTSESVLISTIGYVITSFWLSYLYFIVRFSLESGEKSYTKKKGYVDSVSTLLFLGYVFFAIFSEIILHANTSDEVFAENIHIVGILLIFALISGRQAVIDKTESIWTFRLREKVVHFSLLLQLIVIFLIFGIEDFLQVQNLVIFYTMIVVFETVVFFVEKGKKNT